MRCSYIIPRQGKAAHLQERPCPRPAQNDGRCKIHNRSRMQERRLKTIRKVIDKLVAVAGGRVFERGSYVIVDLKDRTEDWVVSDESGVRYVNTRLARRILGDELARRILGDENRETGL
jgi:hypothetical protein